MESSRNIYIYIYISYLINICMSCRIKYTPLMQSISLFSTYNIQFTTILTHCGIIHRLGSYGRTYKPIQNNLDQSSAKSLVYPVIWYNLLFDYYITYTHFKAQNESYLSTLCQKHCILNTSITKIPTKLLPLVTSFVTLITHFIVHFLFGLTIW